MRLRLFLGATILFAYFVTGYSAEKKAYISLRDALIHAENNSLISLFEHKDEYKNSYIILFDICQYLEDKPDISPALNGLKKRVEKEISTYDWSTLDKEHYNHYLLRLTLYYYQKKDDTNALLVLKKMKVIKPITNYDDFHGGIGAKRNALYQIRHDTLMKGDIFRYYRYFLSNLDVLQYSEMLTFTFLMPFEAIKYYPCYISYWIWGTIFLVMYGLIIFLMYKMIKKLVKKTEKNSVIHGEILQIRKM